MPSLVRFAVLYLVALVFFCWGVFAVELKVFPWRWVGGAFDDLTSFVRGDPDEDISLLEMIRNDLDIEPSRLIRSYEPVDTSSLRELVIPGTRTRRDAAQLFIAPNSPSTHRLIVGAFDFEEAFWGAVLLDPAGQVGHTWRLSAEYPEVTQKPDILKNLYGVALVADGSLIFTMQEAGGALFSVDRCSNLSWKIPGKYHHTVALDSHGASFWTLEGNQEDLHPKLTRFSVTQGERLETIDVAEVERSNPGLFIFELQQAANTPDATHPNDIEVLPPSMGNAFPGFSPGSLMLSYRTTNLLYAFNPRTLKIDWWHVGAGDGQHDPDWQADGTITLFSNNHRAYNRGIVRGSTIVSVDPREGTHRVLVDGERYGFFSRFNGHHQVTPYGSALITSSTQGRVFEVDLETGNVLFDFINSYNWSKDQTLHLSEAFVVTEQQAALWSQKCD
ncbi:MAG: arylsulfotransferase family protein [Pseudomonadota bacterium]